MQLDPFTRAYIACALWAETDNATPQGGEPLDKNYCVEDIHPETLRKMTEDCQRFVAQNLVLLSQAVASVGYDWERAGHDFWLTRNGHGAGFWDRDELPPEVGEKLTEACKAFKTFDLYVGIDNRVHGYGV